MCLLHIAPLTLVGFKRRQAQDYSGLGSVTSLPGVSQIQETDIAVLLENKRVTCYLFSPIRCTPLCFFFGSLSCSK